MEESHKAAVHKLRALARENERLASEQAHLASADTAEIQRLQGALKERQKKLKQREAQCDQEALQRANADKRAADLHSSLRSSEAQCERVRKEVCVGRGSFRCGLACPPRSGRGGWGGHGKCFHIAVPTVRSWEGGPCKGGRVARGIFKVFHLRLNACTETHEGVCCSTRVWLSRWYDRTKGSLLKCR